MRISTRALMLLLAAGLLSIVNILCDNNIIEAQAANEAVQQAQGPTVMVKEIEGEVTWIGDKNISIIYNRDAATGDEYDMLMPYDKAAVQLNHLKSLKDLSQGDIINIQYTEETREVEGRPKEVIRKATVVSFVKKAAPKPPAPPPPAPDVFDSEAGQ